MTEMDEAAVLTRAKALAEQDGFTWEWEISLQQMRQDAADRPRLMSEARRQMYLTLAREEADGA
jgi:hypothetical protein